MLTFHPDRPASPEHLAPIARLVPPPLPNYAGGIRCADDVPRLVARGPGRWRLWRDERGRFLWWKSGEPGSPDPAGRALA